MDVVVTGSSGLVGTALVPALAAAGHRPLRLVRREPIGSNELHWDPASGRIDAAGLEGVDAVVHLGAAGIGDKKWTEARKRKILDSRVQGTTLLADTLAGLEHKPAVLISASGSDYYGVHDDEVLTEDSPAGAGFLAEVCGAWEAATKSAEDAGIRVVRIRTGPVLSPSGGLLKRLVLPFTLGLGGRIGTGRPYMSWIAIDDHVGGVLHLLSDDLSGPVNLTAPNPVTSIEFTNTLGRVLKRPTKIPTPLFPLKIIYGAELVESLLLTGARVVPTRIMQSGYKFLHAELEGALRGVLGKPSG